MFPLAGVPVQLQRSHSTLVPRYPIPPPLTSADLDTFLREYGSLGPVAVES